MSAAAPDAAAPAAAVICTVCNHEEDSEGRCGCYDETDLHNLELLAHAGAIKEALPPPAPQPQPHEQENSDAAADDDDDEKKEAEAHVEGELFAEKFATGGGRMTQDASPADEVVQVRYRHLRHIDWR